MLQDPSFLPNDSTNLSIEVETLELREKFLMVRCLRIGKIFECNHCGVGWGGESQLINLEKTKMQQDVDFARAALRE